MKKHSTDISPVTTRKVHFLYTNIGRGHPFYLDGIVEAMTRRGDLRLVRSQDDVFNISRGIAMMVWRSARWFYEKGSSSSLIGRAYRWLRHENDYNQNSLPLRLMGEDIRQKYGLGNDPIVVAHPILVGILAGRDGLIYQHGELVAPRESLVRGANTVLVPTEGVAQEFLDAGYETQQVAVTGLCIEPALVRQAADVYTARMARLGGRESLTGAFFSSGAEPRMHIELLVQAAFSVVRNRGRALIFGRCGGRLAQEVYRHASRSRFGFSVVRPGAVIPRELTEIALIEFNSRREETFFTAQYFPHFDYFVAPSHERSNWAVGLGLPLFVVEPCIGPFAPLNWQFVREAGVADSVSDIDSARRLGERVQRMRSSGQLERMATAGWQHHNIHGFEKIADFLNQRFSG